MSRLGDIGRIVEEPRGMPRREYLLVFLAIGLLLSFVFMVVGVVAVSTLSTTTTTTSITITSTTSSTTTTTSSTTSTSTSTSVTTTSTSTTTTTTLCGGYYELACAGLKRCDAGFVENSQGVCVPVECAGTVESGNPGCGSNDLNLPPDWCKPNGYNPFTSRITVPI